MAEFVPPNEEDGRPGHLPDAAGTFVELHRLLAIFLASRGFADLIEAGFQHAAEQHDPIFTLQEVEESEVSRILLTLAITARVLDDANERFPGLGEVDCGTLTPNIQQADNNRPLTLREACNKIIHATKRRVDIAHNDQGRPFLQPLLYLYGNLGATEWKATLDVIAFAKRYSTCVARL